MSVDQNGWWGLFWGEDFERRIRTEAFWVHSVFQSVVNLQADPLKPLLSVVTRMEAMGPNALFVRGGGSNNFKVGFHVGSSMEFVSGLLTIGSISIDCLTVSRHVRKLRGKSRGSGYGSGNESGYNSGSSCCYDSSAGYCFDFGLGSASVDCQESEAQQRVKAWLEIMSPGITKVRSALTDQLTQGLLREEEGLVRSALAGFIGQGEGLTPASDDYVAGILLTYVKGFQLYRQKSEFITHLPSLVIEIWERTTTISQTMLWYAACGEGAGYVAEVAEAMLTQSDQVLELAAKLWAIGASSGRYLLAGVLMGCELFKKREQDKLGRNDFNPI